MSYKRFMSNAVVIVSISFLFPLCVNAQSAQSDNVEGSIGISVGDVGTSRQNKSAVRKLRQMTPEEVKALDGKLSEALELYYDRKFDEAFPLFKEIEAQVDTIDVIYWLAMSAMEIGENEVAIQNFQKLLQLDPDLHQVRIQLATAYFNAGYYKEARQELEKVKAASSDPDVRKKAAALSKAMDQKGKVFIWNLKLSQGVIYDDNINASADRDEYETLLGRVEQNDRNRQLKEWASVSNVMGSFQFDFGDPKGFMWDTTVSFYNKSYFDYSDYNYMKLDATTGPWWAGRSSLFKLPMGYSEHRFGNDRLGYTLHADPSFQYDFSRYFSLKALYTFSYTDYSSDSRSDLDNYHHKYELGPIFFLADRRVIIAPAGGYNDHNADAGKYSYDGPYWGVSWITIFPSRTTMFLRYQWFKKRYDSEALPLYEEVRSDKQSIVTAALRQGLFGNLFAVLAFYYIRNDSNLEIYDYKRRIYMVNLEYRF